MYKYEWDPETGGLLLTTEQMPFSKEPRPVYYQELDILGFDQFWNYPKDDSAPIMWAEASNYIYRGNTVAKTDGGSLYTRPELIILENPEPDGIPLRLVDVTAMCRKNAEIMRTVELQSIKRVEGVYRRYKNKVDFFHVSFSGGKDSVVTLDIVRRAIAHEEFFVLFGDTGMEFPDTYDVIAKTMSDCKKNGIDFFIAKSDKNPFETWKQYGPPSKSIRWCCSVHKTSPQLLFLRSQLEKSDLKEMAFVGVRKAESVRRSGYDFVSKGTKHIGQYSCNPILEWTSAEVYLYIYLHNLPLNQSYKMGINRAGCLVCPMTGGKYEYMRNACYPQEVGNFIDIIKSTNAREYPTDEETNHFIDVGGWKVRNNGRDINCLPVKYIEKNAVTLEVRNPSQDWKEWMKTLGSFYVNGTTCVLHPFKNDQTYSFDIEPTKAGYIVKFTADMAKDFPIDLKNVKQVFRKAAYCIACKECQADCPHGCLHFENGKVVISDQCVHCLGCHKAENGCLLYHSLQQPKGTGSRMDERAIDCYADHAPKLEWIRSFFELKDDFLENHSLGSVMINMFKRFLRDAELLENNKLTDTARKLGEIGIDKPEFWGIMLVNLSHTAEVGWYVKNMPFDMPKRRDEIIAMLRDSGAKERGAKSASGAYRRIVNLPFGKLLGLGTVIPEGRSFSIVRGHWDNPIPEVILYALYKFAEACGTEEDPHSHYQFSLSTLLDDTIDRDGVSPTRIFGLDREIMTRILNALSINYPAFINAAFTLGLETITLRDDKTSADVLALF